MEMRGHKPAVDKHTYGPLTYLIDGWESTGRDVNLTQRARSLGEQLVGPVADEHGRIFYIARTCANGDPEQSGRRLGAEANPAEDLLAPWSDETFAGTLGPAYEP